MLRRNLNTKKKEDDFEVIKMTKKEEEWQCA